MHITQHVQCIYSGKNLVLPLTLKGQVQNLTQQKTGFDFKYLNY
jgi:hypothetical protein